MSYLSDIRNAAIANAVIVIFHIYIAIAVEGLDFLVIVIPTVMPSIRMHYVNKVFSMK